MKNAFSPKADKEWKDELKDYQDVSMTSKEGAMGWTSPKTPFEKQKELDAFLDSITKQEKKGEIVDNYMTEGLDKY